MGDIRDNISRHEMACECGCGFAACDSKLMDVLQGAVDHCQRRVGSKGIVSIQITGPNRCVAHNEVVQKKYFESKGKVYTPFSSKSYHTLGMAADHKMWVRWSGSKSRTQISPRVIYDYIESKFPNKLGLILYHNRCHTDVRPKMYREKKV